MRSNDLYTMATNIAGIRAFKQPPGHFSPIKASDDELIRYGLPRRPDSVASPARLAQWKRQVTTRTKRLIPELRVTNVQHRPATISSERATERNTIAADSTNWSGIAIVDNVTNPFSGWGSQVVASWSVPKPSCAAWNPGSYYSSQWVGIDGYGSPDVLQAGTGADIGCPGAALPNYAWFEWYPNYEVRITNLGISPGDQVNVSVSPFGSQGNISIENQTTYQSVAILFDPPPGIRLVGNCVEWVVERPTVNGQLSNLSNYISLTMQNCLGLHYASQQGPISLYYPGAAPTGTIYDLTMIDSSGEPLSEASIFTPASSNLANGIVFTPVP